MADNTLHELLARVREHLGAGPVDGLFYATGHHRNGILLAPVTATAMAQLVIDRKVDAAIQPFGMERFSRAEPTAATAAAARLQAAK